MKWPIIMHINCFEQGQTIEEACKKCTEWGFDSIEFRSKRENIVEDAEDYLDSIHQAVEKYKVKEIIFGMPGLMLDGSDAEKEQDMEELMRFFELASARFKLSILNTFAGTLMNPDKNIPYEEYTKHGSSIAKEEHWEWAVKSFKTLGKFAQKHGFLLAFETHMAYLNDILEPTVRLVKKIDNPVVGINIDYANLINYKNVPSLKDAVNLAGDRLYYVHLKNSIALPGESRIRVGLGEGDINNREYLKILKETGYEGPLCIEVPRKGDREWYMKKDLEYLRKLIEEL